MGHSFTVTTDTDVLILCNESQVSFGDIHSNTSEKNSNFFSKICRMYMEIICTYYYLCTSVIIFFKYILNELNYY